MSSQNFKVDGLNVGGVFNVNTSQGTFGNLTLLTTGFTIGNSTANVFANSTTIIVANSSSNVTITPGGVTTPTFAGPSIASNSQPYVANQQGIIMTSDTLNSAGLYITIVDGASPSIDMSTGINFKWTLGGNRTAPNPTNPVVGRSGIIWVKQDGTGSRTLAFGTNYYFDSDTAPVIGASASKSTFLFYHVIDATHILISMAAKQVTGP